MLRMFRGLTVAGLALAASLVAAPALACGDAGSAAAKALPAYRLDTPWYSGLATSLQLGLLPDSFPAKDIAKAKSPCRRADFQAGGQAWTLYGDKDADEGPPRWATAGGDRKRIVFLAFSPHPEAAYAWAKARQASGDRSGDATFDRWVWVLALTDGNERRIYALYDAMPTDERLVDDMRAVLEGRFPALTVFDVKKADYADNAAMVLPLSLGTLMTKARNAPDDGADLTAAFSLAADGRATAAASGLVCPPRLEGFERSALTLNGPANGGFEVGCRYSGGRARLAIFATRAQGEPFKDDLTLSTVFLLGGDGGKSQNMPGLTGPEGVLYATGAVTMPDGERRSFWLQRRGDWTYGLYAIYPADGQAETVAAASALAGAQAR